MRQRPQAPGLVYTALALILLVMLAAFALTSRQPPPPTIAEFAPQAIENITDAPNDQSSSSGRGGGTGGAGGGLETPEPPPDAQQINVPRVRRCVGDPPRQIEDPQSPPCVPYWEGDNGGATSKGVTRDEIRIASGDNGDLREAANFFNRRFEFYGRKIQMINTSGAHGSSPEQETAAAAAEDEQFKVFGGTHHGKADESTV